MLENYLSHKYRSLQYYLNLSRRKLVKYPGIVIIGCGRSGTTYTAKKFQKTGYEVGHERLLKHGICSWYLVSDQSKVPFGPTFEQIEQLGLPIVHQVRHPLKTISSCLAIGRLSWDFLSKEIPIDLCRESKVLMAMKYWYYWNLKAEQKSIFTFKIEDLDNQFNKILEIGDFQIKDKETILNKTVNTREHAQLSLDDIKRVNHELASKIVVLSNKYGYEI